MLFFPARAEAEAQCAVGGNGGTECEELEEETALLQSKVAVIDHADAGEEQKRALLTQRNSRRRKGWGVGKAVKKAGKTVSSAANSVAKYAQQALSAAQSAVNSAVNTLKNPNTFKNLLPSCLRSGKVLSCMPSQSVSFLSKIDVALENAASSIANCFNLNALTGLVKGMRCTKKIKISYPDSLNFNWPPKVNMANADICVSTSGLNMNSLKSLGSSAKSCAQNIYNNLASSIGSLKPSLLEEEATEDKSIKAEAGICLCPAKFAIFFGAGGGASYGVSAGLQVGFVIGCDGCNFQWSGFWAWSAGVVSNAGAEMAATLGYATGYDDYWGYGLSAGVSVPTGEVTGGGVNVGLTTPELTINWAKKTISKKVCVSGQCKTFSTSLNVPSGVKFVPPKFAGIDIAVSAGASKLDNPVDVSASFGAAYKLNI
jgi:hypothetical protein